MPTTSVDRPPIRRPLPGPDHHRALHDLRPDAAVAHLYRLHARSLRPLARSLVDEAEVDDLISDTFTSVLRALRNGCGPTDDRRGYLVITMRRQAHRTRARRARLPTVQLDEERAELATAPDPDRSTPIEQALRALPPRQRAVLWATAVEGYKPRELAISLDLDGSAAAALAYRARCSFRRAYLDATGEEDEGPVRARSG